jgi:hypothetical protein
VAAATKTNWQEVTNKKNRLAIWNVYAKILEIEIKSKVQMKEPSKSELKFCFSEG